MAFLQTSFNAGYITDLVLPPPPAGKTAEEVFAAGLDLALSMARSSETMTRLNPFVLNVSAQAPSDPKAVNHAALADRFGVQVHAPQYATSEWMHFAITDKLPVLFGYSTDLTYHSALRSTKEGLEALTNAGSGVTIYGKWVVKIAQPHEINQAEGALPQGSPGVIHLLETNQTTCSVLLAWYIKGSFDKSHRTTHRRFKERWVQRMAELGFPSA